MGTIFTKYSVGDKVYIVTSRGLETTFDVELREITGINVGGKSNNMYEFGHSETRGESNIYVDLEQAKKAAKKRVAEHHDWNIKKIDELTLNPVEITP